MKIAIVKISALGDIVHAMVVLQIIKGFNQEILIDWIVEERFKELLDLNPDINKVHLVNIRKARKKKSLFILIKEIKRIRRFGPYDLVIDLQGLVKSAIISRLIPSSITLGFDRLSAREKFSAFFYNQTFNYGYEKNVIDRNVSLIQFGLKMNNNKHKIFNKTPFLYSRNKYVNNHISNTKKNILIVPGASHKSKCYPISKLVEFITILDANFLIIWGNEKEKLLANQISALSPCVNVCKKLSIDSLISLISMVDLVIGPDTGPTHMAWGLNIPSITLFGPTPGYRNTCVTKINKIIESDSNVNPNKINKKDNSISRIKTKDIVDITNNLLS
jgi:heptosyltransferase I